MKTEKSDLQLESVVSRIAGGEIDLQPDFQRGEIWDIKRRQRLIDTILRGWYVPAVHIVVEEDGGEVVLDGQQRLAAIRDFFGDAIRIDGNIEPLDNAILELHNCVYSNLPEGVRRFVNRFVLQVITLTDYEPQEPNELFFRLNQSYNLTPPEKRNALHGEARNQVKGLVADLIDFGLLDRDRIGFSNGRLAYDDIVSRVCVALEIGSLRRHINNQVVEGYYRTQAFSADVVEGVKSAGQILVGQIEATDRVKFNKGTLQTWLVYAAWAPGMTGVIPSMLLRDFDHDRTSVRRDGSIREPARPAYIAEVLRIYDDRSSYRVTDVASVLARDLAIHLYSHVVFGTPPLKGSDSLVEMLSRSGTADSQGHFFDFIERSQWGDQLVVH